MISRNFDRHSNIFLGKDQGLNASQYIDLRYRLALRQLKCVREHTLPQPGEIFLCQAKFRSRLKPSVSSRVVLDGEPRLKHSMNV